MQNERTFRVLALLLFLGSMFALVTFLIKGSPVFVSIPFLGFALVVCTAEVGKRYGKAAGIWFVLLYAALVLFLMRVPYASSMDLSIAFLSFPFFWDAELQHRSLEKTFSYLGLKKDGFIMDAIWGVATTLLLVGPLVIMEAIVVVFLLHLEEPGKVSMLMGGLPWYILIFSFTIAPIAEEVFFRGFLLSRFGVVISTVLFTAAHYSYGSLTESLAAFTAGLIFALLCRRRKSVIPSIFAHATFNFINVAMVILYYWFKVIK
ncbi:CPBP family intramembrane metalloprotease [Candidatus Micrarchaeota archaeon]|nr:CPBP family intramembrane metalloprotease [Candidatus Micrarchaeota archaeon]